jgi:AraC-like DNA-binding protein
VEVERRETEDACWTVAERAPAPALRPYLLGMVEGWEQVRGPESRLREVPFPGVPLILGFVTPWQVEGPAQGPQRLRSFVAGLHTGATVVEGASSWACVELRLTPLGAHRLLRRPMHELTNLTVELGDVLPNADELTTRLGEAPSWPERLDLVEAFLARRLAESAQPSLEVEWSWHRLRRSGGRASIGALATELGWSHRRLIARFREQIGLAPKTAARVLRFDRAVVALRASPGRLAEVAFECGYFDQAHLNRDFRELAGTTPTAFLGAQRESGGVIA